MKYLLAIVALFLFAPPSAHALWLDSNWDYRVKVEIAPDKVGTGIAVTNFPVYVDLAGMPAEFWDTATTGDIRVTESDGTTEVPLEIVSFSTTTERGEMHFRATNLSTTSTSTYYVYYGNPAATAYAVTDTYGRNNVWVNYEAVYHLKDLVDSTGNGFTLTNTNSVTLDSTGRVGGGAFFGTSNTNKRLQISNNLGITGASNKTISAWFQPNSSAGTVGGVVEHADTTSDVNSIMFYHGGVPATWFDYHRNGTSDTFSNVNGSQPDTSFSYGVLRYDTTNIQGRVNTTDSTPAAASGTGGTNLTTQFTIGQSLRFANYFSGYVDEVRVSASVLPDSWLTTEYNNQVSTSTFFRIGPQESDTPPPEPEATTTPHTVIQGGIFGGGMILQ